MNPRDLVELGVVRTASPCDVPWESMRGSPVKRYCTKCRLHVWNFEELTTEEADALLRQSEGRLCARIYTRPDGTVLTRDCPRGLARIRRRALAPFIAVAAWMISAVAGLAALWRSECPPTKGELSPGVMRALHPDTSRVVGKLVRTK